MFIVRGNEDKKLLSNFIKTRTIPQKKKNEWKITLNELWKKFPIGFKNGIIVINPSLKNGNDRIQLTKKEQGVLAEIGEEMHKAMDDSLNNEISVAWGDTRA